MVDLQELKDLSQAKRIITQLGGEVESLRKQLEEKDADIERAIRLTIAQCDSYTTGGSYRVADTIKSAVLAQVKERGK